MSVPDQSEGGVARVGDDKQFRSLVARVLLILRQPVVDEFVGNPLYPLAMQSQRAGDVGDRRRRLRGLQHHATCVRLAGGDGHSLARIPQEAVDVEQRVDRGIDNTNF